MRTPPARVLGILTIVFYLVCFPGTNIQSQDNADSPVFSDHPGASGVFLLSDKTIFWKENRQLVEDFHNLFKVFTLKGSEKFREFRIFFRKEDQGVQIVRAGTYGEKKDFKPINPELIRQVIPVNLPEGMKYTDVLQQIISLPRANVNHLIETHVQRITREKPYGISGMEYFQVEEPILKRRLHFLLPRGTKLKHRILNGNADLDIKTMTDGREVYSFSFSNSPRILEEPAMPPLELFAGRLVYSTYADWDNASREFRQSFFERVQKREKTAAFASDLVSSASTSQQKLEKIFQFVTRDVENINLSIRTTGYVPQFPDLLSSNRYGDWKDKAILMTAMLESIGFQAHPVFVNQLNAPILEEIPALQQFDGILIKVDLDDEQVIYLNPLGKFDTFPGTSSFLNHVGLLVSSRGSTLQPVIPSTSLENRADTSLHMKVAPNGAVKIMLECRLSGIFSRKARAFLWERPSEEVDRYFAQAAAQMIPGVYGHGYSMNGMKEVFGDVTLRQWMQTERWASLRGM